MNTKEKFTYIPKVWVSESYSLHKLRDEVNEFLKDKHSQEKIKVMYQIIPGLGTQSTIYSVMIFYNEKQEQPW